MSMSFLQGNRRKALFWCCVFVRMLAFDAFSLSMFSSLHKARRQCCASVSSLGATVENGASQMYSENYLNSLTVKELREILKGSGLNQRGVLSRLRLKRDLVSFLRENLREADTADTQHFENASGSATRENASNLKSPSQPISMPGLSPSRPNGPPSPKDALFLQVYAQYPPLEEMNCTGVGEDDIRQTFHPIFQKNNKTTSDMDIIFVGTASCAPGITRGVSCTALRLNWKRRALQGTPEGIHTATDNEFAGGTWLFDCGECTQLQVQRISSLKPGKITKIFITHAHGDHSFGLPGLLCLMGQHRDRDGASVVDIYGPEGLRMWLRVAIRYSVSRIVPNYRVHELKDIPMAPEWKFNRRAGRYVYRGIGRTDSEQHSWGYQGLPGEDPSAWASKANMLNLDPSSAYGELQGGRDIFPVYNHPLSSDGAPVWEVEDEEDVRVFAAPMSHGIPCVGYVVEERSRPGRLRNELVTPIVERNLAALKDAGFKKPMKALAVIKSLPVGSAFTFPDGTVVTQEEAVEPPRKGRKVVICGDTASSRALTALAIGADVVIHEATNSYLSGIDKDTNLQEVTRETVIHGHSTPHLAGAFAKQIGAKKLIMNHFSARYRGDQSVDAMSVMMRMERQAAQASGLDESKVAAAWDFMVLPVPQNR